MELFISWSGPKSKRVAEALHGWIPQIINAVKPWLSAADIDKGARWSSDVALRLESASFGIICLTPGNLHSDWILFEAGALSKKLGNTFVCPLLIDLKPADVQGPLAQFQMTRLVKEEMAKLIGTINSALKDAALSESHLKSAFEVWWPKLDEQLVDLPDEHVSTSYARSERDILEEILAAVRSQERIVSQKTAARAVHVPSHRRRLQEVLTEGGIVDVSVLATRRGDDYIFHCEPLNGEPFVVTCPKYMDPPKIGAYFRRQIQALKAEPADAPEIPIS